MIKETPQQFMYRLMGLKQRVLFASKQNSGFCYDHNLVQGVFLHSLYQGMNEKCSYIRQDLKPHISDLGVTDDSILELITKAVSEDAERQNRLGQTHKQKNVSVNVAQSDRDKNTVQIQSEVQANRAAIQELTVQVSSLTKCLEKALTPVVSAVTEDARPILPLSKQPTPKQEVKGKCHQCASQGTDQCTHCFRCGKEGHRAIGCLQKSWSGNSRRSLGRDHQ